MDEMQIGPSRRGFCDAAPTPAKRMPRLFLLLVLSLCGLAAAGSAAPTTPLPKLRIRKSVKKHGWKVGALLLTGWRIKAARRPSAAPVVVEEEAPSKPKPKLPAAAKRFAGSWKQVETDNYSVYLAEVQGLGGVKRSIGAKIPLAPSYAIKGGELCCETKCAGAKSVHETLTAGESTFYEPNIGVVYECSGRWEGKTFVSTRVSPKINGGRPVVCTQCVADDGSLTITYDWKGKSGPFVARYVRG